MLKGLRTYGLVSAVALIALAMLLISPPTQAAKTGPGSSAAAPEKAASPVSELPGPPERATREARESAYDKLGLDGKLIIQQPAPEEPTPAPEPAPAPRTERDPERKPKNRARAGVTDAPVLPETTREAPAQEEAPVQEAPPEEAPAPEIPEVTEEVSSPARVVLPRPTDTTLRLTVPRLGLSDVTVGDSPEQSYLDREGIMHLSETGFPFFKRDSNTYIAGHAGDYDRSRIPNVFRNLDALRQGDLIALRDANDKVYKYRVYERLVVSPRDVWVTEPIAGKKIVSLQTCFPAPTYEKRLVVRGELVK